MADLAVALLGELEVLVGIGRVELPATAVAQEVPQRDLIQVARAGADDVPGVRIAPSRQEQPVLPEPFRIDGVESDGIARGRCRRGEPVDERAHVGAVALRGDRGATLDLELLEELECEAIQRLAAQDAVTSFGAKRTKYDIAGNSKVASSWRSRMFP